MDIDARIKRRQRQNDGPQLVRDYEPLSPVAHVEEPSERGPVFERLLDHLDPVFEGELPPNAYVSGPFGSGKSAVVTALFSHLQRLSTETQSVIHTSTRAARPTSPGFVYIDLRGTNSEFSFYRAVLNGIVDETIPEHGISTDDLRGRLHDLLCDSRTGVVVAVDHVDEPGGVDASELVELFAGLPSNVSWLAIGRTPPEECVLTTYTATTIAIERYRRQMLVDVLMNRASDGLVQGGLDYELAREIADWASGNAHDALAALFVAADGAARADRRRLSEADVRDACAEVPEDSVSLGRVLALPTNKQIVLRELVDLDEADRASVTTTTETISAAPAVELSSGTVERFLYEMAEVGIVERVQSATTDGKGRPPSRLDPRFPPTVFRRLYDLDR